MAKSKPKTKPKAAKPPPKAKGKKGQKAAEAKAAKVDWASPEMLAVFDRETSKEAAQFESEIEALKKDWDTKKEAALTAKKNYESTRTQLEEYVKDREQQRGKPPTSAGSLFSNAEAAERLKEFEKLKAKLEGENAELRKRLASEEKNRATVKAIVAGVAGSTAMPTDAKPEAVAVPDPNAWYPDDLWKRFTIAALGDFGLSHNDIKIMNAGEMKDGKKAFPLLTIGDVTQYHEPLGAAGTYVRKLTDLKGFGPASLQRWETAHEKFWAFWGKPENVENFARHCGYEPTVAEAKPAEAEAPAADGKKLRGGGAKPKAEAKPKKAKKGKAHVDATSGGPGGDGGSGGDDPAREPGRDADGFPESYADPEPAESESDGEREAE